MVQIPFTYQGIDWILLPDSEREVTAEFKLHGVALTRSGMELARVVELEPMPRFDAALVGFFESKKLRMLRVGNL